MSNSTGPATAAGKAISCGNATKHGGASQRLIVEGESQEDFNAMLASLNEHYQPANPQEQELVHDAAEARWKLWRCQRAHNAIEFDIHATRPDVAKWTETEYHRLALADRYKTAAENSFGRALKNLMLLTKQRQNQFRWEAMHDLAARRLELQKERHALAIERHQIKLLREAAREAANAAKAEKESVRSVKCAVSLPVPASPATAPLPEIIPVSVAEVSQHRRA